MPETRTLFLVPDLGLQVENGIGYPIVAGQRVFAGDRDLQYQVIVCPFCWRLHSHSTGDGHRVSHCGGNVGYVIRALGRIDAGALTALCRQLEREYPGSEKELSPRSAITPKVRARIMERDGFHCRRCGHGPEDGVKLVVDHAVPVARNGTSVDSNLQTLCRDCNAGKGARAPHPHDFIE